MYLSRAEKNSKAHAIEGNGPKVDKSALQCFSSEQLQKMAREELRSACLARDINPRPRVGGKRTYLSVRDMRSALSRYATAVSPEADESMLKCFSKEELETMTREELRSACVEHGINPRPRVNRKRTCLSVEDMRSALLQYATAVSSESTVIDVTTLTWESLLSSPATTLRSLCQVYGIPSKPYVNGKRT